ncbi:phiSA1p31-related protein, partial [Kitasatospora aureofaciens]|uniref:phiSA1p31-related protein n=1 Tax=Kitasatospora aureofaciens TaxID=1894 RepID=UPI0005BAD718
DLLVPEGSLDVVERPESPAGYVTIKGTRYHVGSGYRYKDRDGDVWVTRSVGGMARACLREDGTPGRNSFTLAHVVNAHGPLTRA